jgi:uncharacterized membrane protein
MTELPNVGDTITQAINAIIAETRAVQRDALWLNVGLLREEAEGVIERLQKAIRDVDAEMPKREEADTAGRKG